VCFRERIKKKLFERHMPKRSSSDIHAHTFCARNQKYIKLKTTDAFEQGRRLGVEAIGLE
jgi:hypothetical protein